MPGGMGLCHAGTEGTTTAVAGTEAVAELHTQLMRMSGPGWLLLFCRLHCLGVYGNFQKCLCSQVWKSGFIITFAVNPDPQSMCHK